MSSYDEAVTPISNHFVAIGHHPESKPVQGPRGPHLFRVSQDSSTEFSFHLSMSPLTPPEHARPADDAFLLSSPPLTALPGRAPPAMTTMSRSRSRSRPRSPVDQVGVRSWSPFDVAAWMVDTGFDDAVVENFRVNDISGAVLVDLKLDDLKELGVQSFGKRHRLWNEIHRLRDHEPRSSSVEPSPSREATPARLRSPVPPDGAPRSPAADGRRPRRPRQGRRGASPPGDDHVISPAESVSIIGIEQVIPKAHKCSKGERCSKYRRQRRRLAQLQPLLHPISPEQGDQIVIRGDPGNAMTAEDMWRPISDAVPSVVASSDVLGPSQSTPMLLAEEHLRILEARDPQENVEHFLNFQHLPPNSPPSPALEMFPPLTQTATSPRAACMRDHLQTLPRLTIPSTQGSLERPSPLETAVPSRIDRFGTPCSAMDVPVTPVPIGPVSRDASQSVPPDMRYRRGSPVSLGPRRESWQPRFGMARVEEETTVEGSNGPGLPTPVAVVTAPTDSGRRREQGTTGAAVAATAAAGKVKGEMAVVNHAGWMKKRKTRFLRHEWQEHHFTLKGTNLAMRQDPRSSKVLDELDVDDYAVACSSMASNKLSAAFKAMRLAGGGSRGTGGDIDGAPAFAFQLVPAADKKGNQPSSSSMLASSSSTSSSSAFNRHHTATSKTHHFAVKSRDDRIEWMRELMLAKALKQKGEGYQINVNGNTI